MLTHLHIKYERLTSQDIDDIDKRTKSEMSGDTEFEAFVQHIEDGKEDVALKNPYTDIQILNIAENLMESTGFYTMDCREWNHFKVNFCGHSGKKGTSLDKLNM